MLIGIDQDRKRRNKVPKRSNTPNKRRCVTLHVVNPYYIAHQADLRCDPNYSFEIGDVDSDGRLEFGCLNQDGNRLRFVRLDGSVVFDCRLRSNGNWGTPLPSLVDINGDGADEVVVPDSSFNQIWRGDELLNDFAHEFYLADTEGDDADEIAFCTLDHINAGYGDTEWNTGELVIMDHDRSTILRRGVDDYCRETHLDDLAFADFRGEGKVDLLTEKGQLLDPHSGDVMWNVADSFDHGQWVGR